MTSGVKVSGSMTTLQQHETGAQLCLFALRVSTAGPALASFQTLSVTDARAWPGRARW